MTNAAQTNSDFSLAACIADHITTSGKLDRIAPTMVMELLNAHRESATGDPIIIVGHDEGDLTERAITYADVKSWAIGEMDKDNVSLLKARIENVTPRVVNLRNQIDKRKDWIKEHGKTTDPFVMSEVNEKRAENDDDTRKINAAMKCARLAIFSYVWIVENPNRAVYQTATLKPRDKSLTYQETREVKGKKKTVTQRVSSSIEAGPLRADYAKWNETPQQKAEREETEKKAAETKSKAKRASHDNITSAEQAVDVLAKQAGGEYHALKYAHSIVAKYATGDATPKGDTREEMVALLSALQHIVTAKELAKWEKENAA